MRETRIKQWLISREKPTSRFFIFFRLWFLSPQPFLFLSQFMHPLLQVPSFSSSSSAYILFSHFHSFLPPSSSSVSVVIISPLTQQEKFTTCIPVLILLCFSRVRQELIIRKRDDATLFLSLVSDTPAEKREVKREGDENSRQGEEKVTIKCSQK